MAFLRVLVLAPFLALAVSRLPAQELPPTVTRTSDVIYGREAGLALTMDVFKPAQPNGYGIIYLASGGWYSGKPWVDKPQFYQALLDRGYTVFAIVHGAQPKFTIPEIAKQLQRAVRYIRANAASYGIDPDHIGITGSSSGGHLSLLTALIGKPGDPAAKDPVNRETSAIQCVAVFYPPTDFLNYGEPGKDAVGIGRLEKYKGAFGPAADTPESRQQFGREFSPIYLVSRDSPPIFIFQGDADDLVSPQQAESFIQRAREVGADVKLEIKPGGKHGWEGINKDVVAFADWFDAKLKPQTAAPVQ